MLGGLAAADAMCGVLHHTGVAVGRPSEDRVYHTKWLGSHRGLRLFSCVTVQYSTVQYHETSTVCGHGLGVSGACMSTLNWGRRGQPLTIRNGFGS